MSDTTWRTMATACHFLVLFVHVVGGLFLSSFSAHLFGGTFDLRPVLGWAQIFRPPFVFCLLAIWLPLPIGVVWAHRLISLAHYRWSVLVSLLTPLISLLLVLGVIIALMPLTG